MRYTIILLLVLSRLVVFSQTAQENEIQLKSDYSQVQNKLYQVANSTSPLSGRQIDAYTTIAGFVKQYPKSENDLYLIAAAVNLTLQQYNMLLSFLDTSLNSSPYKVSVDYTKRRIALTETGRSFPPLSLTDSSGNATSIENYRGKFVLLDFWSSWCTPCREQIPDLKKLYSKFKNKDFEIVGISMDNDKATWLTAIAKDKQTWKQYCELVPWRYNKISAHFSITGIPANFLLDKNGIILGQDLSPDQVANLVSN